MGSTIVMPSPASTFHFTRSVSRWLTYGTIVLADLLALCAAGTLAVVVRYVFHGQFTLGDWIGFAPVVLIFGAVFALSGLYPGIACSPTDEFRVILRASTISFLLLIVITFLLRQHLALSRIVIVLAWGLTNVLVPVSRRLLRGLGTSQAWWGIATVILGDPETAGTMLDLLNGHARLGLRPVALLLDSSLDAKQPGERDNSRITPLAGNIIVGDLSQAQHFGRQYPGCYALVAMPTAGADRTRVVITEYLRNYRNILIVPDLFGVRSLSVSAKDICGVLTLKLDQRLTLFFPKLFKRSFDLLVSASIGVMLAPLFLVLCLAVKLSSKGPIFYGQRRIGRYHSIFKVWKFRTMLVGADEILQRHLEADPALREEWDRDHKLKRDPRVTGAIGRLLRKTSLDELPQLWNVLNGEMSLVGPRPIVEAEIEKYGDSFGQYQLVTPGVTGLWQVSGRNNTTYDLRTRIDDYYVRNWSLSLDIYILLRTVKTILLSEGAY